MAYRVLILDDDVDFNSLLTDIFEQADYDVTSILDPLQAIQTFADAQFDLVVTDHKMPQMTGAQFMGEIKKIKPEVPVIMVSGYLENDTIRELIGQGVGGVFLKPLNIFSLLERTAELIADAQTSDQAAEPNAAGDIDEPSSDEAGRAYEFRSFPCKSQASADFAERLYSLRQFKSTLSLIGAPGTQFHMICEDIRGFYQNPNEHFIYLSPSSFDAQQVLSMIGRAEAAAAERVTCVLLEVERMSEAQKKLAACLPGKQGVFESVTAVVRTIFCMSSDLDALYDDGLVDEDLYILMGTAEVYVPSLQDCAPDIAVMAQQIVVDIIREKGLSTLSRFDAAAQDVLSKQPWEHNYAQLRATVRQVMDSHAADVLTDAAVNAALQVCSAASAKARFETRLSALHTDYVRAVAVLFGGDRGKVADFFGTDPITTAAVLR